MDLPSQEVEIPMPLSSAHVNGHVTYMIHDHDHDHDHRHHDQPSPPPASSQFEAPPSNGPPMTMTHEHDHHPHHHVVVSSNPKKQQVKYRECLKNHAAAMGGNATDGCGEFMPAGEEGSIEFLTCSACNCHRNFHRKEVEGQNYHFTQPPPHHLMVNSRGRKVINLGHHHKTMFYPPLPATPSGGPRMIPYTIGPLLIPPDDQSDDQEELQGGAAASDAIACRELPPPPPSSQFYLHHHSNSNHHQNQMMAIKKRFRTKFTPEQKEKMLGFAEKAGWKIQKQEESVVQQFCQEIGVKRRVLKVWMHNNKHNLAKKNSDIPNP